MKYYYSLGLMSGTSGDGVDASLINSDGGSNYKVKINKYFEYENNFRQKIHNLLDVFSDEASHEVLNRVFHELVEPSNPKLMAHILGYNWKEWVGGSLVAKAASMGAMRTIVSGEHFKKLLTEDTYA